MSNNDFDRALKEAMAAERGDTTMGELYEIGDPDINVREIREDLGMSQRQFASSFGLSLGSVRNWEQGRSDPDVSMVSYLIVIKYAPEAVLRALAEERRNRPMHLVQ